MLQKNSSFPFRFQWFSDEALPNLHPDIVQVPEPSSSVSLAEKPFNYRKEACLCDDNLGNLTGQRVFFFDLDVLIMGNLDALFSYPQGEQFYIINDWNSKGDCVGQATCYSFVVGTLGSIKKDFETNPDAVIQKFGTASQNFSRKKWSNCTASYIFGLRLGLNPSVSIACHGDFYGIFNSSEPPPDTKVLAFTDIRTSAIP